MDTYKIVKCSKLFTVEVVDEWDYDEIVDKINSLMQYSEFSNLYDTYESDNDEKYPSRILHSYLEINNIEDRGFFASVKAHPIIRCGLNGGINLDIKITYCFEDFEFNDITYIDKLIRRIDILTEQGKDIESKYLTNLISGREKIIIDMLEKLFTRIK